MKKGFALFATDLKDYYKGILGVGAYIGFFALVLKRPVCPLVYVTGFPCPACGMTRAALLFLQGDFAGAWRMHPFFYVLLLLMILAGVNRYVLGRTFPCKGGILGVVVGAAVVFYIYRLKQFFPHTPPMTYDTGSLFGAIKELHIAR